MHSCNEQHLGLVGIPDHQHLNQCAWAGQCDGVGAVRSGEVKVGREEGWSAT